MYQLFERILWPLCSSQRDETDMAAKCCLIVYLVLHHHYRRISSTRELSWTFCSDNGDCDSTATTIERFASLLKWVAQWERQLCIETVFKPLYICSELSHTPNPFPFPPAPTKSSADLCTLKIASHYAVYGSTLIRVRSAPRWLLYYTAVSSVSLVWSRGMFWLACPSSVIPIIVIINYELYRAGDDFRWREEGGQWGAC